MKICIIPNFTPERCDRVEDMFQSALMDCPLHFEFDRALALEGLIQREKSMSTAIGGFAVPHTMIGWTIENGRRKLSASSQLVLIFCRFREAIVWPAGSLDEKRVPIMIISLLPEVQLPKQLYVMENLAKFMHRSMVGKDLSESAFVELVGFFAAANHVEEQYVVKHSH